MHYISTRGHNSHQTFSQILLGGLAADGGLYLPSKYPTVTSAQLDAWRGLSYADLAFEVLSLYCDDMPSEDLRALVKKHIPQKSIAMVVLMIVRKILRLFIG